jgi:hypothetical protein
VIFCSRFTTGLIADPSARRLQTLADLNFNAGSDERMDGGDEWNAAA